MKKIISAEKMRLLKSKTKHNKIPTLKEAAVIFVNYIVYPAMLKTDNNCVNVPLPSKAYEDVYLFIDFCKNAFPIDYKVKLSQDGSGSYDTLSVSWAE